MPFISTGKDVAHRHTHHTNTDTHNTLTQTQTHITHTPHTQRHTTGFLGNYKLKNGILI